MLLHSAEGKTKAQSSCPESFPCGHLGLMKFPFSNFSRPHCGLFLLNCDVPSPQIQVVKQEQWYKIKNISRPNAFEIHDKVFQNHLDYPGCDSFSDITPPNSPIISFTLFPNLTLYKCINGPHVQIDQYFNGYYSYKSCGGYSFYYRYSEDNQSITLGSFPPDCSIIHLPV
ncbi:unnamed protein product [Ilex paraguariensis]|uniref:Wall-associated receptor kinase galacturonan-binding domain-containing protein n=1 Tax=Ilex paraguariensis TaxID=185542 RepID=A0ABC8S261_9AQUA